MKTIDSTNSTPGKDFIEALARQAALGLAVVESRAAMRQATADFIDNPSSANFMALQRAAERLQSADSDYRHAKGTAKYAAERATEDRRILAAALGRTVKGKKPTQAKAKEKARAKVIDVLMREFGDVVGALAPDRSVIARDVYEGGRDPGDWGAHALVTIHTERSIPPMEDAPSAWDRINEELEAAGLFAEPINSAVIAVWKA